MRQRRKNFIYGLQFSSKNKLHSIPIFKMSVKSLIDSDGII